MVCATRGEAGDVAPDCLEGFETVAGLVLKLTGRIPQPNDTIDFKDYRIKVLDADRRRVKAVRFTRKT